ncbi:MAG: ABC transporter permease [Asgard group archaeon]|nr:ABC transporter permease [Asgard group archaeon]
MSKKGQFLPILRKDLKLVFTWKTIIITVVVPFLMMFLIIGMPSFFIGLSKTTITICSDDVGSIEQHVNGTLYNINLGNLSITRIQQIFENNSQVEIVIVDTRSDALNASNGIYIPVNFTEATFDGLSIVEVHKTASNISLQGAYFDQALIGIQEVIINVFLYLNLEAEIPEYREILYSPPEGEPTGGWSQETVEIAGPFAYAMFILISLVGTMGRTIGFGKEKEDGTFETMLTITKNRSNLVYSKLIVGVLASMLSIFAYFLGSVIAGRVVKALVPSSESIGLEGILAIPFSSMISYRGIFVLLGLGVALVITMLALMTVDTLFSKTVAERVGTAVVMGFGFLFYFTVAFDPGTTAIYAQINPFYWIYHAFMSLADLSYGWVDAIYTVLFIALLAVMVFVARKAIEREKVLFT